VSDEAGRAASSLSSSQQALRAGSPAAEAGELPRQIVPVLLSGILCFLLLFALYFAGALLVPFILAFILSFLLKLPMRLLVRCRVPKVVAGLLILLAFFGVLVAIGSSIAVPAASWIGRAPESLSRFEARLEVLREPFGRFQAAIQELEKMTEAPATDVPTVTLRNSGFAAFLLNGTTTFLAGFLSMLILLYFLLVAGDLFLRRLVENLPSFGDKKQAVEISREIERNISIYLGTITLMNTMVGVLTGIATYFCGLPDPLLWGAMALLLNFILLLGPLLGIATLCVVGLSTFDTIWHALLPAALYLVIHLTESQLVTPMLLARRFTLNPVAIILSLLFWYWMWGVAGALLAIPVLATFKITCDRIRPLMAIGHFLEGEPHRSV
jgi:predicted PurR-regulated permease PerM